MYSEVDARTPKRQKTDPLIWTSVSAKRVSPRRRTPQSSQTCNGSCYGRSRKTLTNARVMNSLPPVLAKTTGQTLDGIEAGYGVHRKILVCSVDVAFTNVQSGRAGNEVHQCRCGPLSECVGKPAFEHTSKTEFVEQRFWSCIQRLEG